LGRVRGNIKSRRSTKGTRVNDYKVKSDEYHKAMIDAKATGEHIKAAYYYERYVHYKKLANKASQ
jgi:pSer/pThr/pTyr-binding forkhead associated (FHA) protein